MQGTFGSSLLFLMPNAQSVAQYLFIVTRVSTVFVLVFKRTF